MLRTAVACDDWMKKALVVPVALALSLAGLMGCSRSAEIPETTASQSVESGDPVDRQGEQLGETGVVVAEVGEKSALEKAGLRPGDILFSWERLPSPPANPQAAQKDASAPYYWAAFQVFGDWQ